MNLLFFSDLHVCSVVVSRLVKVSELDGGVANTTMEFGGDTARGLILAELIHVLKYDQGALTTLSCPII